VRILSLPLIAVLGGDLVKLQGASGKAEVAAGKAGAKGCEAAER